ncbi:hypothetical protein EGR_10178 [Echinococcus granulosus]|uniref:Uncharacterized protein n=1 Tax=Echinococcus granulosus TaxID=6210 RepID=W6U1L0_ECHGR|nr:hypothetical protein EGR_10178 [Echinococcus granulosus]EUB54970.1 hypothetical protein EGR_10178 [Echinococcus granulosus]
MASSDVWWMRPVATAATTHTAGVGTDAVAAAAAADDDDDSIMERKGHSQFPPKIRPEYNFSVMLLMKETLKVEGKEEEKELPQFSLYLHLSHSSLSPPPRFVLEWV